MKAEKVGKLKCSAQQKYGYEFDVVLEDVIYVSENQLVPYAH